MIDPVSRALEEILDGNRDLEGGEVSDYIPELAKASPEWFALSVVSVLGRTYEAGDSDVEFTAQSISKPFVYALALSDVGLEAVAERVGFEPSGEPYNAFSLEEATGRPANPLINAGAIAVSGLVLASSPAERIERIIRTLSAFAGRDLEMNEKVYDSEAGIGDRNRALAYLMKASGVLTVPVDEAHEAYTKQCSVMVTAKDVAVMGATLANAGINPITGDKVVDEWVATTVLSVMSTCGMYDDSGEWMVRVGLPAKSGVGGGIVATKPAQFGIGVFSPPIDAEGNSVKGVAALEDLSERFRLHLLAHPLEPRSPIIDARRDGDRIEMELRGELDFIAVEQVADRVRRAADELGEGGMIVLDLTGVSRIRSSAEHLLALEAEDLAQRDVVLRVLDPRGVVADDEDAQGARLAPIEESEPGSS